MKNRVVLLLIFVLFLTIPLFSEKLVLEDEEERNAPVEDVIQTAIPTVKIVPTKIVQTSTTIPVSAKSTAIPTVAATPKPAATTVATSVQNDEIKAKVEYLKASLESSIAANNEMASSIREIQFDLKRIEERSLEIKGISQDMEEYKQKLSSLEEKYTKDKISIDKALDEFDKVNSNLKASVDKLSSWSDILEVLKKGISNNELEMAKLKKTINDLKLKYGENDDNVFSGILKWPYAGFTALVLSIIALSVAVAK